MNGITRIAGLGALVLALSGCPADDRPNENNYIPNTMSKPTISQEFELTRSLEGSIVKVQPSSVSYSADTGGLYVMTANHAFEYVMLKDNGEKIHTFIYPTSRAILEGDATLTYWPLSDGSIDAKGFFKTFINGSFTTDDNVVLEAEGVIKGIK